MDDYKDPTDVGLSYIKGEVGSGLSEGIVSHSCAGGWMDDDYRGLPVPCLSCRPHLRPAVGPGGVTFWRVSRKAG